MTAARNTGSDTGGDESTKEAGSPHANDEEEEEEGMVLGERLIGVTDNFGGSDFEAQPIMVKVYDRDGSGNYTYEALDDECLCDEGYGFDHSGLNEQQHFVQTCPIKYYEEKFIFSQNQ